MDGKQEKESYLLSTTVYFAQRICRVMHDMAQLEFSPLMDSLKPAPFATPYRVVIFSTFFGKITGQFVFSMDRAAAAVLGVAPHLGRDNREDTATLSSEFLKEVLNTASGQSLMELENVLGNLTLLPPSVVYGEIEFPEFMCAGIEVKGDFGAFMCHCCLNLADLQIGKELEEARRKLTLVHESQNAMLVQPEDIPIARFSVFYSALDEAGGDFYDVFKFDDNLCGYFVADIAGHDIGVGFLTASVRALLRQNCTVHFSPETSVGTINNVLCDILSPYEYVTGCYAVLDRRTGTLTVLNMGHPPLLLIPRTGEARLIQSDGDVLGMFRNTTYSAVQLKVSTGDRFVLYTDGLVEGSLGGGMGISCRKAHALFGVRSERIGRYPGYDPLQRGVQGWG